MRPDDAATPRCSWSYGPDDHKRTPAGRMVLDPGVYQAGRQALSCEGVRLWGCPAMTGQPSGAGSHQALDREEPAAWSEHSLDLSESCCEVFPVVNAG
jgi:hypothetical protein